VNGGADQLAANNTKSITSLIPPSGTLPVNEVFTSIPASWTIHNPDNLKTWQLRSTPGHGNAMFVNCYDYDNEGTIDRLITPVYDLTDVTVAFLRFERAHAIYNASQIERLKVIVTDACNFTSQSVVIFNKSGSSLATASATQSAFVPTSTQWTTETFSLNQFTGRKIQIAFEATNGFGNNIYLDNVSIIADEFVDGALVSVESPSPVSCVTNVTPVVRVKNMGGTTLESFRIEAVINGTTTLSKSFSGLSITSGEEQTVSFNPVFLVAGNNNIVFTLAEPNGILDSNEADNTLTVRRVVNTAGSSIPLRQNFEGNFQNQWTTVSQGTQEAWTTANTNKGKSLVYSAFDNPNLGDESWFVSPVLDFSKAAQASLFFDISYGKRAQGSEQLKVFYSTDCGITFSDMIFEQFGSFLSTATSVGAWVPATDNQWKREYLNLSSLAGSDNMRFAFVAKADNGNNLYVDNIEFFIDDDPFPVSIADQYSVYGGGGEAKITFKLTERQPVQLTVYNTMGQVLVSNELPETLNQTYSVKLSQASGIYIFKLQIGSVVSATKVYLE